MTGTPPDPLAETLDDPLIGRTIAGKFQIESPLGTGAMGAVYKARQLALDRAVAIKVLHRKLETDVTYAARFDREARSVSRLDHPNILRVLDYGKEPDGLFYIAMEFLDGRDLFQVMEAEWPLSPARIVDLISQTLGGLAAAHDAGIIHRDLKPENIMLLRRKTDDGTSIDVIKLCDFGVAKMADSRASRPPGARDLNTARKPSTEGFVVGTPEFMSPEQAHGEELDARSDVYSIGVILYQLLTGRLPFEADTALGVVLKLLHDEPPAPSEIVRSVDSGLERVCLKAMNKLKANRFADAREMRSALKALIPDAAPSAPRPTRNEIANAPTIDFVPPLSTHATASLSAIAVQPLTKPRPRVRRVIAVIAAIGLSALSLVFWKHQRAHFDEAAASSSNAVPLAATSAASLSRNDAPPSPIAIAPPAASIPEITSRVTDDKRHTHRDSSRKNISSSPPPTADVTAPPPPITMPPEMNEPTLSVTPPPQTPPPSLPPQAAVIATPPSAPFDSSNAHVDLGTPRAIGTSSSSVSRALSPIAGKISACYRSALTPANSGASSAMLHVQADESGFVTDAHVTGAPANAAACIEAVVRGLNVPDVDTGSASADIPLSLRPR